jgi:hypothetical protein
MRDHRLREVSVPGPIGVDAVAVRQSDEVSDPTCVEEIVDIHPAAHRQAR